MLTTQFACWDDGVHGKRHNCRRLQAIRSSRNRSNGSDWRPARNRARLQTLAVVCDCSCEGELRMSLRDPRSPAYHAAFTAVLDQCEWSCRVTAKLCSQLVLSGIAGASQVKAAKLVVEG